MDTQQQTGAGPRPPRRRAARPFVAVVAAALLLSACGGDDDAAPVTAAGDAQLGGTLAYVAAYCRESPAGVVYRETLRVQRGESAPVDAAGFELVNPDVRGSCAVLAASRIYSSSRGAIQRLVVSPDGRRLVFELSDDFSQSLHDKLPPESEGFFAVDADGGNLRRLGPQSGEPAYFISNNTLFFSLDLLFTPDGGSIVYVDRGPGPDGESAAQIVRIDLDRGTRRQLTHLPRAVPAGDVFPGHPAISLLRLVDDSTLGFVTASNPDGLNPAGEIVALSVPLDGGRVERLPQADLAAGSHLDPRFQITGKEPTAGVVVVPGEPTGPPAGPLLGVQEIFLRDGRNLLQLTNFKRADTFALGPLGLDGRAIFTASADPLGANPQNNCQVFSIDRTGANLRQLTRFSEGDGPSLNGCTNFYPKGFGCFVNFDAIDAATQNLVFESACDPFGRNDNGSQLFVLRPDGSGLRQITQLAGLVFETDGSISGEGPSTVAVGGGTAP